MAPQTTQRDSEQEKAAFDFESHAAEPMEETSPTAASSASGAPAPVSPSGNALGEADSPREGPVQVQPYGREAVAARKSRQVIADSPEEEKVKVQPYGREAVAARKSRRQSQDKFTHEEQSEPFHPLASAAPAVVELAETPAPATEALPIQPPPVEEPPPPMQPPPALQPQSAEQAPPPMQSVGPAWQAQASDSVSADQGEH